MENGLSEALQQLAMSAAPVPIIIGVVEVVKRAMGLKTRYAPVVAIGLGLLIGGIAHAAHLVPAIAEALPLYLGGLVAGLMACGIYSAVKATLK